MDLYDTPALFVRGAEEGDNAIPPEVEGGRFAPGASANGRQSRHGIPSTGTPESEPFKAVEQAGRIMPSSVTIPEKPAQGIYLAHELASDDASRSGIAGYLADLGRTHDNEQDLAAPVGSGRCRLVASMSGTFDDGLMLGMFHVKHSLAVSKARANALRLGACEGGLQTYPPDSQEGVKAHTPTPAVALPHKIAEAPAPKPE
jgi:hypothetical protein